MKYWMYLSLWAEHGGQPGLGLFSADNETGELVFERMLNDQLSLGCSEIDEKRNILYVCNEIEQAFRAPCEGGRIYGFSIDRTDGSISQLFCRDTYCSNPSYLALSPDGKYMVVAHISKTGATAEFIEKDDGTFEPLLRSRKAWLQLYEITEDGTPGALLDVKSHKIVPESMPPGSFLHCAVFSPEGDLFAVCDKGSGSVYLYRIDSEHGKLILTDQAVTDIPGAHPRYCVFHPTLPYFVVNHEHMRDGKMIVSSFSYDREGHVKRLCTVNALPADCTIPKHAHFEQQGLAISADGKTVYTCLNGPNAVCALDLSDDGMLSVKQYAGITGEWLRGLTIMPGGRFLAVSCLVSGDIVSFRVSDDGSLSSVCTPQKLRGGTFMSFMPISQHSV